MIVIITGHMESFYPLSEQFITQSEPSYCALSSLAMVLNALNHDPKKIWKGNWRWVSEETLQCESANLCGHSLEKVKVDGMNFDEFESLAECHDVIMRSVRVSEEETDQNKSECEQFRQHVKDISSNDSASSFVIVNFSRRTLGQTGSGHFSPIGGYHPEKDLVLILDVARFKYPPFWVPLATLWQSMQVKDEVSKGTRGYFLVSTREQDTSLKSDFTKSKSAQAGQSFDCDHSHSHSPQHSHDNPTKHSHSCTHDHSSSHTHTHSH